MLSALGKKPNDKPCNTIDTLIGVKSELKGDIVFSGGLRIDGKVRGNVTVPHIISNGAIKGSVRAAERIELQNKAEITGDVYYKVIEMALGAVVNGSLVREVVEAGREGPNKGVVTRLKTAGENGQDIED